MKRLYTFLLINIFIISGLFAQVTITNTSDYKMAEQMLLANEINESGEPYAEALGYDLDALDPMVLNQPDSIAYTLGLENYEYSRYQLGTVISRSGIGLHMMWSPVVMEKAAMMPEDFDGSMTGSPNGYKEDDMLIKTIMHFSMLSNHMPPGNPWPQFADFIGGDPHLPQAIDPEKFAWEDFSTLRWDRSKMDKTLNPAAMGQSLMKQYLWAQDMLSAFHDSLDNGIEADGEITPDSADSPNFDPHNNVYYGGDGLDGFIGQVLTAEAINKVKFTIMNLAYDGSSLGMVDPATYNPADGIKYFPHKIAVTESMVMEGLPPKAGMLTVTDAHSNLFDQFSLLWGTLHFKNMMDPNNTSSSAHLAYKSVFDGDPFPADMSQTGTPGPFDLMKGTSKVIFLNLKAMHFLDSSGTFVDESIIDGGTLVKGNTISTLNAAYIIVALGTLIEEFQGSGLDEMAKMTLIAQADFLLENLKDSDNSYFKMFTIGEKANDGMKDVTAQAAAVRGLYAAFIATGDHKYHFAANDAYEKLIEMYYVPAMHAFRTEMDNETATYTPLNFAVITGALREANLVGGYENAPAVYTRFFKKVANVMQLSEAQGTGESGSDSDDDGVPYIPEQPDNLPPVFAAEATLDLNITAIEDGNRNVIDGFTLSQNYPNPFNPTTQIEFSVQKKGFYNLSIYDITGKVVRTLISGELESNNYSITLDGRGLSSGIYYYKLQGMGQSAVKKLVLLK